MSRPPLPGAATFQTLPDAPFVVNGSVPAYGAALVTASGERKWLNGFSLAGTFEGSKLFWVG